MTVSNRVLDSVNKTLDPKAKEVTGTKGRASLSQADLNITRAQDVLRVIISDANTYTTTKVRAETLLNNRGQADTETKNLEIYTFLSEIAREGNRCLTATSPEGQSEINLNKSLQPVIGSLDGISYRIRGEVLDIDISLDATSKPYTITLFKERLQNHTVEKLGQSIIGVKEFLQGPSSEKATAILQDEFLAGIMPERTLGVSQLAKEMSRSSYCREEEVFGFLADNLTAAMTSTNYGLPDLYEALSPGTEFPKFENDAAEKFSRFLDYIDRQNLRQTFIEGVLNKANNDKNWTSTFVYGQWKNLLRKPIDQMTPQILKLAEDLSEIFSEKIRMKMPVYQNRPDETQVASSPEKGSPISLRSVIDDVSLL